jgi:phosphoserine phosphatase RsbU/P
MACLETAQGFKSQKLFLVCGERTLLGRQNDCDIVLNDKTISRHHAQILHTNLIYFIEDLNSSNGTYVNGQKIQGRRQLHEKDQITLGDLSIIFHLEHPPEAKETTLPQIITEPSGKYKSQIISTIGAEAKALCTVNAEAKLTALLQITQNLSSTLAMEEVFNKVLESLFGIFIQADRGFLILRDKNTQALTPKVIKCRRVLDRDKIQISHTILEQVIKEKTAILSADAASDSRFDTSESILNLQIRSVMCAPLIGSSGQAFGAIQLDTAAPRQYFQQEDLNVLATIAGQASFAIEHAQLHEAALKKRELERDLDLADKVQHDLLPPAPPVLEAYDFFNFYQPAYQIGGDYYDYISLPGGRLAILLADVSGKGISAALVMAKLSAEVRCCFAGEDSPAVTLSKLNNRFIQQGWEDRFITLAMIILDPSQHTATLVNAGHLPPLLRHANGEVEAIGVKTAGTPLGVLANYSYQALQITLDPGDSLILFTDGFNEAMNEREEFFGLEQIGAQLKAEAPTATAIGQRLINTVNQFMGSQTQNDDMCLVCLRRMK